MVLYLLLLLNVASSMWISRPRSIPTWVSGRIAMGSADSLAHLRRSPSTTARQTDSYQLCPAKRNRLGWKDRWGREELEFNAVKRSSTSRGSVHSPRREEELVVEWISGIQQIIANTISSTPSIEEEKPFLLSLLVSSRWDETSRTTKYIGVGSGIYIL